MMSEIKLILGDCLEIMKTIPDKSIDLVLTDPPYHETDMIWDKANIDWIEVFDRFLKIMKPNASLYIFGKQPFLSRIFTLADGLGLDFKFEIIWFKNAPAPHSSNYQPLRQHENIWCFTKRGEKVSDGMIFNIDAVKTIGQGYKKLGRSEVQRHRGFGDFLCENEGRFPISVIYAQAVRGGSSEYTGHNTQKPLDLIRWFVRVASNQNNIIFDPFMGSGTTGVACAELGRSFIGIEIDKGYFDIAEKRIKQAQAQGQLL